MTRIRLLVPVVAGCLFTGLLYAEPIPTSFNVPFDFTVGGKTMPAGKYTVSFPSLESARLSRFTNGHESVNFVVNRGPSAPLGGEAVLTFHVVGNRYFLGKIDTGSGNWIREVSVSRTEREAIKSASQALRTVTIAASLDRR